MSIRSESSAEVNPSPDYKTLADRTGARLVFGHDADVLAEFGREEFYD